MTDQTHYWNEVGKRKRSDPSENLWRTHSDAINSGVLKAWLPVQPGGRVLKTDVCDEAVGDGLYGALLARFRCVVGMDLSFSTAQAAPARAYGHPLINCDVRSLPFASDSFDAVASISTLDHFGTIAELACALAELHRVLRRGRSLVLTLDNAANPVIAARNFLSLPPVAMAAVRAVLCRS
jgi:SAM-dependent methyltransferase